MYERDKTVCDELCAMRYEYTGYDEVRLRTQHRTHPPWCEASARAQ